MALLDLHSYRKRGGVGHFGKISPMPFENQSLGKTNLGSKVTPPWARATRTHMIDRWQFAPRAHTLETVHLTRSCDIESDGPSTRGRMSWGRPWGCAIGGNGTIVMWVRGPAAAINVCVKGDWQPVNGRPR
jgi:hypothetical protein